VGQQQPPHG